MSVVVWDAPSTVECGEKFIVKLGAKCSSECRPDGWTIEVLDHDGNVQATAAPSDEPWPGTAALYFAEVELSAPDTDGGSIHGKPRLRGAVWGTAQRTIWISRTPRVSPLLA